MIGCEHRCGNSTYRVLGPGYNTRTWIKWMREHGVPSSQVPINGSWVVRNVAAKQVIVLVYDWNEGDDVRPEDSAVPCHVYRDGVSADLRYRAFVSQLDREPEPFPTGADCDSDEREPSLCRLTTEEYEHRPLQLTGESVAV